MVRKLAVVLFGVVLLAIVVAADRAALPGWIRRLYDFPGGDKVGHLLLMGTFAFLADLAARGRRIAGRVPLGSAVVAGLVTAEELTQALFPARTFSGLDLAASLAGIATGAWLAARGYDRRAPSTKAGQHEATRAGARTVAPRS